MKGPYGKLRYRVQRVWQCPVCQRRERTPGHVVARRCTCQADRESADVVWMRLIEEPTRRPNRYDQQPGMFDEPVDDERGAAEI